VTFEEVMDRVAQVFEAVGAAVLLVGLGVSIALCLRSWRRLRDARRAYRVLRQAFGGVILLGLELLVAADLVRTVAVEPTVESVLVLAGIVLIRIVLGFSLETEIEGVVPWRRRAWESGAARFARTAVDPRVPDGGPESLR
jgi:uncharacterized membrane protein